MQELQQTLVDLIQTRSSATGYEIEQIVKSSLSSRDNEEAFIARDLQDKYFENGVSENFKPLKFVHYKIVPTKDGEYILRRNLFMSPRATGYFSREDATKDGVRELMRTRQPILGADLKRIVAEALERKWMFPDRECSQEQVLEISHSNLSKQLAEYINTYFINCDKPIKDDIWYCVSCKEYATATIYRDLEKSPRMQHNKREG